MSTRQSPAAIRAFNYAIESIHDAEGQAAFRRDHARMIAQGIDEFTIISMCHEAILTMAYLDAMQRAAASGNEEEAIALAIVVHVRSAKG